MRPLSTFAAVALMVAAAATGLARAQSPAATALTPDQQLVAKLNEAAAGFRAAHGSLTRPSSARALRATAVLLRVLQAVDAASTIAPRAVGALETPSLRVALREARRLGKQAITDLARRRYSVARLEIEHCLRLGEEALQDFGVPLEKEFAAFAVSRDFASIPAFTNYSGVSATVGNNISEVVIGAADRTTANAGVRSFTAEESAGLPITARSAYVVSDPIGRFTSGWCTLNAGLITCRIRPAMPADNIFTIAFGPKLANGTRLLVKFRSESGERSYAVFSTR